MQARFGGLAGREGLPEIETGASNSQMRAEV